MKLVANITNYVFNGKLKKISRFSVTGVLNTLIDFAVFTIAHSLLGIGYTVSQVAGYSFGVINSFVFNKKWTFQNQNADKIVIRELIQFIIINLISLTITILCMKLLVNNLGLNVYVSKIIVTLVAQVTNFIGYKLWVFSD
ncbi:MAG: GtrA family protein [Bacillota bacterium]|nr:GtrA family protein [Bacillota bacterium]